eukprot:scaffold536_cov250-Pinguiococcus_pyrenoidosus.AAC.3
MKRRFSTDYASLVTAAVFCCCLQLWLVLPDLGTEVGAFTRDAARAQRRSFDSRRELTQTLRAGHQRSAASAAHPP